MSRISVQPRAHGGAHVRFGVPVASLVFALMVGAVILALVGNNPFEAYRTMYDASLNGWTSISRSLTLATPLILTGLAAAIAFRMKVYNIGAEGQLYLGAIASSWVALALPPDLPKPIMLTFFILGGAVAGAIWAGLAAIPRAFLNADEIITTLMLNFVALSLMNYLIFGSMSFWRDPERPVPQGLKIPESARLPILSGRLHAGVIVAVVAAALLWWVLRRTSWGFQVRTIGDSPDAARYAGMNVKLKLFWVLAISGALAGIAGAVEVSGVTKSLEPKALATEIGFTGIIVAVVARMNPLGVVPVSIFLAAIATSGSRLQSIGIQVEVVFLLQGLIFLSVTAGEFFVTNKVSLNRGSPSALSTEAAS
ncbi:MAG: ABC transporter permease [Acidimicrobiales bacterium]